LQPNNATQPTINHPCIKTISSHQLKRTEGKLKRSIRDAKLKLDQPLPTRMTTTCVDIGEFFQKNATKLFKIFINATQPFQYFLKFSKMSLRSGHFWINWKS